MTDETPVEKYHGKILKTYKKIDYRVRCHWTYWGIFDIRGEIMSLVNRVKTPKMIISRKNTKSHPKAKVVTVFATKRHERLFASIADRRISKDAKLKWK